MHDQGDSMDWLRRRRRKSELISGWAISHCRGQRRSDQILQKVLRLHHRTAKNMPNNLQRRRSGLRCFWPEKMTETEEKHSLVVVEEEDLLQRSASHRLNRRLKRVLVSDHNWRQRRMLCCSTERQGGQVIRFGFAPVDRRRS